MEQEPERELLSDTVKRVGYNLALAAHAVFIAAAFVAAAILFGILLSR